jgi:hypothetical protein
MWSVVCVLLYITCCGWAILFINNRALLNLCIDFLALTFYIKNLEYKTEGRREIEILYFSFCCLWDKVRSLKMHSKTILFCLWWPWSYVFRCFPTFFLLSKSKQVKMYLQIDDTHLGLGFLVSLCSIRKSGFFNKGLVWTSIRITIMIFYLNNYHSENIRKY